jgi:hypothetical protein
MCLSFSCIFYFTRFRSHVFSECDSVSVVYSASFILLLSGSYHSLLPYTIAMPEAGCLGKAHLDIQSKAGIPGSSGLSADHPLEHGMSSKLCVFYISANILTRATSFS